MAFAGELRPFQAEAVETLLSWGGRGLLSIVMGGGKTPTAIALIEQLLDEEKVEAGLVVVPPGLKRQWVKRLAQFAPDAHVALIDGTPAQRAEQYHRAVDWAEYIVLGYPQLVDDKDWSWIKRLPRDFVVADEVQAIKNFRAKRSRRLKQLGGGIRLGLTGQPMENRPEDVFSIGEWIDADVLGHFEVFDATFVVRNSWGRPVRYKNLPLLRDTLKRGMMVRYSRDDIKDQLPERTEETYVIDFDSAGRRLYHTIAEDLVKALDAMAEAGFGRAFDIATHYGGGDDSPEELALRGKVMSRMTCLRMLCDHPGLLLRSAELYQESQDADLSGSMRSGSEYAAELASRGLLSKRYGAPKFDATLELIREILDEDPANKVAVFSFFKPTLSWLQQELGEDLAVVYTGDVSGAEKQAAVDRFNTSTGTRVFLSSDAGGSGVDLPGGNYHINYDLPFSAGQLEQRNARLDRIASEHSHLLIVNHLMTNSIEEFYQRVLLRRQKLAAAAVDGKRTKKGSVSMDLGTLRDFLLTSEV